MGQEYNAGRVRIVDRGPCSGDHLEMSPAYVYEGADVAPNANANVNHNHSHNLDPVRGYAVAMPQVVGSGSLHVPTGRT